MPKMKVTTGGMCLDMNRHRMYAGTEFDVVQRGPKGTRYGSRQIPADVAADWHKNGYCEPLRDGERSVPNPEATDEHRQQAHSLPGVPAPVDGKAQVSTGEGGVHSGPPRPSGGRIETPPSPWTFNPQDLEGKSLEELNAIIADRLDDRQRQQFSPLHSIAEAIHHLSQDFQSSAQVHRQQ